MSETSTADEIRERLNARIERLERERDEAREHSRIVRGILERSDEDDDYETAELALKIMDELTSAEARLRDLTERAGEEMETTEEERRILDHEASCLCFTCRMTRDLDRFAARLAVADDALEPFALVAEHDIGEGEADEDVFRPMSSHNHAPKLKVGDLRRAAAIRARVGKDKKNG